jgi:hypothetical protein
LPQPEFTSEDPEIVSEVLRNAVAGTVRDIDGERPEQSQAVLKRAHPALPHGAEAMITK